MVFSPSSSDYIPSTDIGAQIKTANQTAEQTKVIVFYRKMEYRELRGAYLDSEFFATSRLLDIHK